MNRFLIWLVAVLSASSISIIHAEEIDFATNFYFGYELGGNRASESRLFFGVSYGIIKDATHINEHRSVKNYPLLDLKLKQTQTGYELALSELNLYTINPNHLGDITDYSIYGVNKSDKLPNNLDNDGEQIAFLLPLIRILARTAAKEGVKKTAKKKKSSAPSTYSTNKTTKPKENKKNKNRDEPSFTDMAESMNNQSSRNSSRNSTGYKSNSNSNASSNKASSNKASSNKASNSTSTKSTSSRKSKRSKKSTSSNVLAFIAPAAIVALVLSKPPPTETEEYWLNP